MANEYLSAVFFLLYLVIIILYMNHGKGKIKGWKQWIGTILLSLGLGSLTLQLFIGGFFINDSAIIFGKITGIAIYLGLGSYLLFRKTKKIT